MNTLREALQEYLDLRRSLGFKMHDAGLLLPRFVSFMETRHAEHISNGLALEWAQNPSVQPAEWARRLCFVRGFARHRSATDTRTEIPPVGMLPHRSTRARPHLYTEAEVRRLLNAALELPVAWPSTPLRPWVFHCLIGLLSVTGLRISEALNLELGDVDLEDAVLTIRGAKLGRSRLVPIHPTTCTVLADYLRRRKQFLGRQVSSYVFVTSRGTRLDIGCVAGRAGPADLVRSPRSRSVVVGCADGVTPVRADRPSARGPAHWRRRACTRVWQGAQGALHAIEQEHPRRVGRVGSRAAAGRESATVPQCARRPVERTRRSLPASQACLSGHERMLFTEEQAREPACVATHDSDGSAARRCRPLSNRTLARSRIG